MYRRVYPVCASIQKTKNKKQKPTLRRKNVKRCQDFDILNNKKKRIIFSAFSIFYNNKENSVLASSFMKNWSPQPRV
ncbi:MAG: hypothetical protein A3H02_01305 [Candidatus Niyogibacteria bacterium RIFCSPLOWO2_12_FULL_41_13]|uniref:Uncharacterized protein n=1 Tax=Candidatus Niyogibacteria bacterium RIFCSPLOWO2_12_FULL_41_13 TaxID=1801726 RepID=A0A1G2F0S7_9BACT|nr:MAG: hypothetical protein A3H02_01305 [Candidatus Niyogibacteria bacterium RIFCSPLOWO2_12_FULL_41_13]